MRYFKNYSFAELIKNINWFGLPERLEEIFRKLPTTDPKDMDFNGVSLEGALLAGANTSGFEPQIGSEAFSQAYNVFNDRYAKFENFDMSNNDLMFATGYGAIISDPNNYNHTTIKVMVGRDGVNNGSNLFLYNNTDRVLTTLTPEDDGNFSEVYEIQSKKLYQFCIVGNNWVIVE